MTKEQLLNVLDTAAFRYGKYSQLYEKYRTRIDDMLYFLPRETKTDIDISLDVLDSEAALMNCIEINEKKDDDIFAMDRELSNAVAKLKVWVEKYGESVDCAKYRAKAASNEFGKYARGKFTRKVVSIVFLALFVCAAVVTAVFAFLDNFQVIDYGGIAVGASGIIDFVVGVVAFIVERLNDSNVTCGMNEAGQVTDRNSYDRYIININKSFNKCKIIDKRRGS